jgi:hypothetical protein
MIIYYILVTILIAIILYRIFFPENNIKSIKDFDSIDHYETGDLIFTSYHNLLGKFMRGWSGSLWSHVGIILRDNKDLYVLETADYSDKDPKLKGLIAVPLKQWLSLNKKCRIAYMKLNSPKDFDKITIAREFLKLQNLELDNKSISLKKFIKLGFKQSFSEEEFNTQDLENPTCYELIVLILQNSKIVEKVYSPGSYFASDIMEGKLKTKPGFSFEKAYEIKSIKNLKIYSLDKFNNKLRK